MSGKEHLFFGITTATTCILFSLGTNSLYFADPLMTISGAVIGSVLPDIDSPQSTIGNMFSFPSVIINKLMGHRTYTHDLAIWIPLSIILTIKYPILFGFFLGYLGHLLLDSLTPKGVPVLYLFNKKRFHLLPSVLRIKSSFMSKIATLFMTIAVCFLTYKIYELMFV